MGLFIILRRRKLGMKYPKIIASTMTAAETPARRMGFSKMDGPKWSYETHMMTMPPGIRQNT